MSGVNQGMSATLQSIENSLRFIHSGLLSRIRYIRGFHHQPLELQEALLVEQAALLGQHGAIELLLGQLGSLKPEDRSIAGVMINEFVGTAEQLLIP
jgi:hypothetical protein